MLANPTNIHRHNIRPHIVSERIGKELIKFFIANLSDLYSNVRTTKFVLIGHTLQFFDIIKYRPVIERDWFDELLLLFGKTFATETKEKNRSKKDG